MCLRDVGLAGWLPLGGASRTEEGKRVLCEAEWIARWAVMEKKVCGEW
jgi:hypothetical protein